MEIICQQKTTLIKILSGGAKFVLQHVHQAKLITGDEYGSLKDDISHHSRQDFTINLLDKMIEKGDKQCHKFLKLLELKEMRETFPQLNDLSLRSAVTQGDPKQEIRDPPEVDEYKMSSVPRGVCVIINNVHFERHTWLEERSGSNADEKSLKKVFCWLGFTLEVHRDQTAQQMKDILKQLSQKNHEGVPEINEYKMSSSPRGVCVIINNMRFDCRAYLKERRGSMVDVESLDEVFKWLGFTVEIHTDKTAVEMKEILMELSQRQHNGDCFICCILSHDCDGGFCGTDGQIVNPSDILQPFGRANCQSLADKPKVFILHTGWEQPKYAIPDSDFLLALATIPGLHSYRHVLKGSWFIQSLCKMLKEGCKRREDILTILNQVIVEVSTFDTNRSVESNLSSRMSFRQIPHIDLTLKKRLVFHVPSN